MFDHTILFSWKYISDQWILRLFDQVDAMDALSSMDGKSVEAAIEKGRCHVIGWLESCLATRNHLGISKKIVGVMPRRSFIYWTFWDFNRISLPSAQNIIHESQKNHFVYVLKLLKNASKEFSSNLGQASAAKGQTITVSMAGPKPVNRQQVGFEPAFGWSRPWMVDLCVFLNSHPEELGPQWPHLKISGKSYWIHWFGLVTCFHHAVIHWESGWRSMGKLIPPYPFIGEPRLLNDYDLWLAHLA